jgi:SPP1 gp7 family putative phage head morphogenesis protein
MRRKIRRIRRPLPPNTVALAYAADLLGMLGYARALVEARLVTRLPKLSERASNAVRVDAARPPGRRVNTILDGISEAFYRKFNHARLEALAARYMDRTQKFHREQFAKQIQEALGIELPGLLDRRMRARVAASTAQNVSLIKSIPQTYFDQVEKVTVAGLSAGHRHEEISRDLEERFEVAKSSARLVARDQTLKFYGEVNKVRQEALGVSRYTWRTVNDERVRSVHGEFDGNVYSWDDPPGDGSPHEGTHPSTGINCRCWAEPVLEDIVAEWLA